MAAPMRVLIQCKSHVRPLRPEHVRELEGAVAGAPPGWKDALGLLVSPREASKGVRERVGASKHAVGYLMVDGNGNGNHDVADAAATTNLEISGEVENGSDAKIDGLATRKGKIRQFLWNWVAQERGLEGLGVTVKYKPVESPEGKTLDREIALTWNGWTIKRTPDGMNQESLIPSIPPELSEPRESPATPKKRGRPKKSTLGDTITTTKPRGQKKKK
jgi:Protein of unknown function (DUF2034)